MPCAEEDLALQVHNFKCSNLCLIVISHYHRGPDQQAGVPDPFDKESDYFCHRA